MSLEHQQQLAEIARTQFATQKNAVVRVTNEKDELIGTVTFTLPVKEKKPKVKP